MGYHCTVVFCFCRIVMMSLAFQAACSEYPTYNQVELNCNEKQPKPHRVKQCYTNTRPNMLTEEQFALVLQIFSGQINFPLATGYVFLAHKVVLIRPLLSLDPEFSVGYSPIYHLLCKSPAEVMMIQLLHLKCLSSLLYKTAVIVFGPYLINQIS